VVAVLQHGGGAGLDAQLVLDGDAVHVVARAQAAVGVDQELRADEQADALHALGRAGHAGQHQVDDVVRHVVLAVGDEDLGAEELVVPSGCGSARVRTSARSLPACGSVRFMVPVHCRSTIFGR
jgi:hypothetical protein